MNTWGTRYAVTSSATAFDEREDSQTRVLPRGPTVSTTTLLPARRKKERGGYNCEIGYVEYARPD